MKKTSFLFIYFSFLFFVLNINQPINAQSTWQSVRPYPQGNHLNCIKMISLSTIIAAGDNGAFVKSTDAGATWSVRYITTNSIKKMAFINANTFYFLTDSFAVMKTTDGGNNWQITFITGTTLNDMDFGNADTGIVAGSGGILFRTVDGNNTWTQITTPYSGTINDVDFTSPTTVIMASNPYLLKSNNAGLNWGTVSYSGTHNLLDADYDGSQYIIVGHDGYSQTKLVLRSTNNGSSWSTASYSSWIGNFYARSVYRSPAGEIFVWGLYEFGYSNWGTAFPYDYVCYSNDAGNYYNLSNSELSYNPRAMSFFDDSNGFYVGDYGLIFKTTNAGVNFTSIDPINTYRIWFTGIATPKPNRVVAVGFRFVAASTDNGSTWSDYQWLAGTQESLTDIGFADSANGMIVSTFGKISKSTNGGVNWVQQYTSPVSYLSAVSYKNPFIAVAVGKTGNIIRSQNGGQNWAIIPSGTTADLNSIYFTNANTGWIVGNSGTILKTSNSGYNWVIQNGFTTATLIDVCFFNNSTGFITGSGSLFLKTTNGGTNWSQITSPDPTLGKMNCSDANNGTLLSSGKIFKTTDAGSNWFPQYIQGIDDDVTIGGYNGYWSPYYGSPYGYSDVQFLNSSTGFIAGPHGTILRTTSNGFPLAPAPNLISPANGTIGLPLTPNFDWSDVPTAVAYRLQISTDSMFTTLTYDNPNILTSEFSMPAGNLSYNIRYYWRAGAINIGGLGYWSQIWNFTTILAAPALINPPNGSINQPVNPVFDWNDQPGVDSYRLQVSTDTTFSTIAIDTVILIVSQFTTPVGRLNNNTLYYWRVNATNAGGTSSWSAIWNFTTIISPPVAPVLLLPPDNTTGVILTPTLQWNSVPTANSYRVQIFIDSLLTTGVFDSSGISQLQVTVPSGVLLPATRYFWRVNAANIGGFSPWSVVWRFMTIVPPIAPVLLSPVNNSVNISLIPLLDWNDVPGEPLRTNEKNILPDNILAVTYKVQVSTDSLFNTTVVNDSGLSVSEYQVLIGKLATRTKYFWRVRANNGIIGPWSAVWNFKTVLAPPALSAPANNSTGLPLYPVQLVWNPIRVEDNNKNDINKTGISLDKTNDAPLTYEVQLSTDSLFGTFVINPTGITTVYYNIASGVLTNNFTWYYWRVRGNDGEIGPWSAVWRFRTRIAATTLLLPANGATGVSLTPLLDWSDVTGALSYRVQVSTSITFTPLVVNQASLITSEFNVPPGILNNNTQYYWRVKAYNGGDSLNLSSVFNFTTVSFPVLNLKVYLEGFYSPEPGDNNNKLGLKNYNNPKTYQSLLSHVPDTIRIYLADSTLNYAFVDTAKVMLSDSGIAATVFDNITGGRYYIIVRHRNHLETWSKYSVNFVGGNTTYYDFTTSASKAFGDNMKQAGSVWVLFGGDPNQDGDIGAQDIPIFISQFGTQGYLSCDFNGDDDVTGIDQQILIQNFGITVAKPGNLTLKSWNILKMMDNQKILNQIKSNR